MKKFIMIALLASFAMIYAGCGAALAPPGGFFYTGVEANKQFDSGATTSPAGKMVFGESCAMGVLGLAAWGDAGLDAAMKEAGSEGKTLKNVAVDHSLFDVLHLYTEYCTQLTAYVAE